MPKKATIKDVYKLAGVEGGIAHGDVKVEEQALEEARAFAEPTALTTEALRLTRETVSQLADAGQLPDDPAARRDLAGQIADAALGNLKVVADERVSFHERAVAIAQEMPDVHVVSGPGFTNLYVSCKPDGTGWTDADQETLNTLADPAAHRERRKQAKAAEG